MSLAMYAAPFESVVEDVRPTKAKPHTKTQKVTPKVSSLLQSIQRATNQVSSDNNNNNICDEDNEGSELANFQPLPPPSSAGVENTKLRENMQTLKATDLNEVEPLENDNVDLRTLRSNFMNNQAVEKYYQNLIPTYKAKAAGPGDIDRLYAPPAAAGPSDSHQILLDKLNYMINLLEEQQDERTHNVTEEVILYSFLGIFIIYIVDSFARVGKYTR